MNALPSQETSLMRKLKNSSPTATCAADEQTSLVGELFEQYHAAIFAYLYRLVDDVEWAHDLTQETFLRVLRARQRLPAVQNQRAWVYRIATNVSLNALKRRRRFAWLPWSQSKLHTPDTAGQSEQRLAIEQALAELPPHYRAPLLLYSHYGLSVREVAEALDIKPGAVKTRLHRAREMFRKSYRGEHHE
jgi:RNA polymerase sigma-70 factor (ECF subfamily)